MPSTAAGALRGTSTRYRFPGSTPLPFPTSSRVVRSVPRSERQTIQPLSRNTHAATEPLRIAQNSAPFENLHRLAYESSAAFLRNGQAPPFWCIRRGLRKDGYVAHGDSYVE